MRIIIIIILYAIDPEKSGISQGVVIGIVFGGAIVLVVSAVVIVVCCILLCGVKPRDTATLEQERNKSPGSDEKVPDATLGGGGGGTISPEVIQMESSPKMYRKAQIDNQYVASHLYQPRKQNHHSNATTTSTAAYNPYITREENDYTLTPSSDGRVATTPPAYLGNPASRFY